MIEPDEAKILFDKLFKEPSQLIDLAAIPDEKLRVQLQGQVHAQALLLSLKHVFDHNLQEYLESVLLTSLQTMDQLGYKDEVADLLYYLYNEGNLSSSSQFWSFLHRKFSNNVEEKVMTLGQQAVQQAVQQAAKQKSQEIALNLLEKKLDILLIAEVTHLSVAEIKQLAKERN